MWIYSWNNEIMKTKDSSYFTKFFLDTMKNHILNIYKFDGNPERSIFDLPKMKKMKLNIYLTFSFDHDLTLKFQEWWLKRP